MAQRNPMNDRYTGDGPQGKTRKSAAKLKPKTEAASSVHIPKKPQTRQEKKAALKRREKQEAAKEAERRRKKEEREKLAKQEAGEEAAPEPQKKSMGTKVKEFFVPEPSATAAQAIVKPTSSEYKRLKRIYWILMGVGIGAIVISLLMNFMFPMLLNGWGMMVPMAVAYIAVIGAIILDYTKIRKMQRAQNGEGGKKSPKQLKHEQERAEAARLMEEQKRAQRKAKRSKSKLSVGKSKDSDEAEPSAQDEANAELDAQDKDETESSKTESSTAASESEALINEAKESLKEDKE